MALEAAPPKMQSLSRRREFRGLLSGDFVVGLVVFVVVLSFLLPLADDLWRQTSTVSEERHLQGQALSVSDLLLRSPGYPSDWNETTVQSIGLANEEHVLNSTKVLRFLNVLNADYYTAKSRLGLPSAHVNFSVTDKTGAPLVLEGNLTQYTRSEPPTSNAFSVKRLALVQLNATHRQLVNLNVVVWK